MFGHNFLLFNFNFSECKDIDNLTDTMPELYLEIIKTWLKTKHSTQNNIQDKMNFKDI